MLIKNDEKRTAVKELGKINADLTFDGGQAFRWLKMPDGSFSGVVSGFEVNAKVKDNALLIKGIGDEEFQDVFFDYFDMGRDYDSVLNTISRDEVLGRAVERYGEIRLLNQERWEALCTFIFSSCNNIKRIRQMVERLTENYGKRINHRFSFPDADTVGAIDDDMAPVRAGYRARFAIESARLISSGSVCLDDVEKMTTTEARDELMKLPGVGKKVADCALLFGFGRKEAFPVDRHIMRFVANNYPDGIPSLFTGIEGIAQQYMFCLQRDDV